MKITQEQLIESLHPHIVPEDEEYPIHMSLEAIARADKDLREKTLDTWWQRC